MTNPPYGASASPDASTADKLRAFMRERGASIAVELLVNFVAPYFIYDLTRKNLGDVPALIASSAPPILWSLIEFARKRRVDALSMLVLGGIVLSLLAFIGGGGITFLRLREKLVTGLIGAIFLGSAAIGKPLIYQLARATIVRRSPSELEQFEALRDNLHFRRAMMLMTVVWGCGLILEAGVAATLVFTLSVRQYLLVSPVLGYGTMGGLFLWTFWYRRQRMRFREARLAAEAAAQVQSISPAVAGASASSPPVPGP